MKNKKFFLIMLLFSLFVLTACGGNAITTKSGLIEQSKNFNKSLKQENKLLSRLSKELNSLIPTSQNLDKDSSLDDFETDLQSRDNSLKEIDEQIKFQSNILSNFDKTIKQNNKNFPNHALKQVSQSNEIVKMDYENFNQYLKKAQDVEKNIKNSFDTDDYDEENLADDLSSLNQFYGAMNQQLEIWQVNLARVNRNSTDLLNELK